MNAKIKYIFSSTGSQPFLWGDANVRLVIFSETASPTAILVCNKAYLQAILDLPNQSRWFSCLKHCLGQSFSIALSQTHSELFQKMSASTRIQSMVIVYYSWWKIGGSIVRCCWWPELSCANVRPRKVSRLEFRRSNRMSRTEELLRNLPPSQLILGSSEERIQLHSGCIQSGTLKS